MGDKTQETTADIIAEMKRRRHDVWISEFRSYADRLEASHKRETDVLKQRCAELDAEVAAKDEVIKRLNDALAEEQKRSGQHGNAAKLRAACAKAAESAAEIMERVRHKDGLAFNTANYIAGVAKDALAEPSRNCDRFGGDIDKLREACARERGLNPEEDFPDVFPDWLLAPATEKKGGAK